MEKVLIICGPTATGKTALALSLAEKFNGELVSADSRQVYTGMDVGTGKDLPGGSKWEKDHFRIGNVSLWGYNLTSPKQEYSVAQYVAYAHKTIKGILQRGHLPILVGGTGLYIKAVIDGIETAIVPRNLKLRKNLVKRSTEELYEHLAQLDAIRAAALNASDRQNPRRLIRAIEIGQWELESGKLKRKTKEEFDTLFIGLTAPKDVLDTRIEMRIEARLKNKVIKEIETLIKNGIGWEYQSMSSLGYRQLREYYEGRSSLEGALILWAKEEKKYVKRQLTWWKQDQRINWQDISVAGWNEKVEKKVKIWYSLANAEKN